MLLKVDCLFSQEDMKYGIQSILHVLAIFKWSSVTYSKVFGHTITCQIRGLREAQTLAPY